MGPTFSSVTASDAMVTKFGTPGKVISTLFPYILVGAGLFLLVTLLSGGITLMTAAGDPGKTKEGYGKITAGLIGFIIIFVAFFVAQVLELALGVKFL